MQNTKAKIRNVKFERHKVKLKTIVTLLTQY